MKILNKMLLFTSLFILLSCHPLTLSKDYKTVTALENGQTIIMGVNNVYGFKFNECVGCASVWEIAKYDSNLMQYLRKEYSNRSCKNCVGGNQDVTFLFKAISTGSTELIFTYFNDTLKYQITIRRPD
jgi:hypothetical protein